MPDYPNFAGKALFKDVTEPASPDSGNLAVYSESGVLKTKTSGGTVTSLGAAPSNMVGATGSTAGTAGLVPAPAAGNNTRALFSDASFGEIPLRPQYKPSNTSVIRPAFTVTRISISSGPTISGRYFMLMYAPVTGNIDTLRFRTGSSGPSSSQNINLAAWKLGEDGFPSTYIVGANVLSGTSATTDVSVSISSTQINRGFFFISLTASAGIGAGSLSGFVSDNTFLNSTAFNNTALNATSEALMHYYVCGTSYDQTTHETFTVQSSYQAQPNVGFEYA
jgi:hypothetical protein